ncbi:MAG: MATE family efflux transporter, partial [Clostridiales bacterium]|nr:MATE family efflux transporter [Clostridiales bacterium]
MRRNNELLEGNIFKTYINYLLPSIGGMLGISLYVLGDTLIVGRGLGSSGLTALNVSIPIMNIFSGLGLLLGIGGATIVSIFKGQNREDDTHRVFSISTIISIIFGLLIMILGLTNLEKFSLFLGAEKGKILNMSMEYLRPLFISSVFFVLNSSMTVYVRNDNNPRLSMISMLTGTISNVVLDYIFVIVCNMGMFGAGLATSLSPIISLAILSIHFLRGQNNIRFVMPEFEFALIKRIFSNGASSFIIESMAGVVIFGFNKVILGLEGNTGVAAYSIIANLSLFCVAVLNGI